MDSEHILLIAAGVLMFSGFGIALIRTAAGLAGQAKEKAAKCTARASGRVIRNEKSVTARLTNNGRRRITAYHPVVRFMDASGKTHECTHCVGVNPPSYKEGEVVVVLYDPERPNTFILPKDDSSPIMRKFLILFGILCFFAAASFGIMGFYLGS